MFFATHFSEIWSQIKKKKLFAMFRLSANVPKILKAYSGGSQERKSFRNYFHQEKRCLHQYRLKYYEVTSEMLYSIANYLRLT